MKKILVTGSNGQLGNEIRDLADKYGIFEFVFTDIAELDICDYAAVDKFVSDNNISLIVNCAAYTAVDRAEDDVDNCIKANSLAPANLGKAAAAHSCKVVHVSTDYVFNGRSYLPYTEDCDPHPETVYGKTKLEGERNLVAALPDAVILRTAWLYSSYGNNFVKTMIRLGNERESLSVVFDQIGTPTYAADLALCIMEICRIYEETGKWNGGIYHFSNEGVCSWYDFTHEIHRQCGINTCKLSPILSKDYPAKATRPHYSVLDKSKIKSVFGIAVPHWTESLAICLKKLGQIS